MHPNSISLLIGLLVLIIAACGEMATLPVSAGTGHSRHCLRRSDIDANRQYRAGQGWPSAPRRSRHRVPVSPLFASGLDHPRWLYVLPNGDVLVAETNAPPKPDDARGIKGWVMGLVMKRAGARGAQRQPHHAVA
jgi:glucose/arabinose dehydrogenase